MGHQGALGVPGAVRHRRRVAAGSVETVLSALLPLAERAGSDSPDDGTGVGVIVALLVGLAVLIGVAWLLVGKVTSRRRGRASGSGS